VTVQVVLDASSGAYRIVRKGDHDLKDDAPLLSDFLLEMGRQGWEYDGLDQGVVTLRRPHRG
jgi:hypothetical protein